MSGSKRKSNTSSDFKRIKAKVGKKAQRQHETDVSFQSASLHLGQSIQRENGSEKSENAQLLISGKGKSLYLLVSTASTHHAAAARVSSLRGILDIIKNHTTDRLLPNLSTLIPVCIHSCVDEDKDARSAGFDSLSSLFQKLSEKRIHPFGALLIARISSALHSLDASIRVHGVRMVNLLCTTCPSLAVLFTHKLLPPFSGLLADQRTKKAIDEILQSLISLLRLDSTSCIDKSPGDLTTRHQGLFEKKDSEKHQRGPDLFYISGGRSRNAILRTKRPKHILPNSIESISNLPHLEKFRTIKENLLDDKSMIDYKVSLISKLRDCLVESINLEHDSTMVMAPKSRPTRSLTTEPQGSTNHSRVLLLLRSIRFLSKSSAVQNGGIKVDEKLEFDKVTQHIVTVLIGIFPIDEGQSATDLPKKKDRNVDHINASIAICILELSQDTLISHEMARNNDVKEWMKIICSYVIPRICHLTDIECGDSSSDLDLTCKFLRRIGTGSTFHDDLGTALVMLKNLFFCSEDAKLARSIAGRRISMIFLDLIDLTKFSLDNESNSLSKSLLQFITVAPFYLKAWGVEFLYESQRLLEGLHRLIQEVNKNCDIPSLESIRSDWYKLAEDRIDSVSIFEMYPWGMQTTYLGVIVLLEKPCNQTLNCLASICSRSALKKDTAAKNAAISRAIMETVKMIRKTIPMQQYLTFIFQSIGLSRHVKNLCSKKVFERAFFEVDLPLNRAAKAFVELGSTKVLRMILPQLCSWQKIKANEGANPIEYLLKMRASQIILAYFFLLESSRKTNKIDDKQSIFDIIEVDMTADTIAHSICAFINCVARTEGAMDFHLALTSPSVAIMSVQHIVLDSVIHKVNDMFHNPHNSKLEQQNLLLIIDGVMKDPRLINSISVLSSSSKEILEQLLLSGSRESTPEKNLEQHVNNMIN